MSTRLSPSLYTSSIMGLLSVSLNCCFMFTLFVRRKTIKTLHELSTKRKKSSALKSSLYRASSFNVECIFYNNGTPFGIMWHHLPSWHHMASIWHHHSCSRRVGDSRWWGSLTVVRLEIRLKVFRRPTIPQKQFIFIFIIISLLSKHSITFNHF